MKIILIGGGTLGSVSPLIGIWQSLRKKDISLKAFFIGTKNGPESILASKYQIPYQSILSGKLRRYPSLRNLTDIFKIILAFFQSIFILQKIKPDVIVSAGSFAAVPLIWASGLFKTRVVLYQPDLTPGLANRLCQKQADYIFTAFDETSKKYPSNKVQAVGTVLRHEIKNTKSKIKDRRSRLLILGGGTGSQAINQLIKGSVNQLSDYQILHVTGKGKSSTFPRDIKLCEKNFLKITPQSGLRSQSYFGGAGQDRKVLEKVLDKDRRSKIEGQNYQSFELLTDDYYQKIAEADLVVSRAGLSTLMELSCLSKPVILIPLPNSPQEKNAKYFCKNNGAVCLKQAGLTSATLTKTIKELMQNKQQLKKLSENIYKILVHGGEDKIAQKIYELK